MSAELIAILAVGVALGAAMLTAMRSLRAEMSDVRSEIRDVRTDVRDVRTDVREVRNDVGDLRERMARLEGLFEGFTGRVRQEAMTDTS